jgi:hypothetical protein
MTREQWFAATNPDAPLALVRQRVEVAEYQPPRLPPAVARRLALFGCACARMVWDLLPTDARSSIQVRERHAEGRASDTDLRAAGVRVTHHAAVTFTQHALDAAGADPGGAARSAAKAIATRAVGPAPTGHTRKTSTWHAAWTRVYDEARATQAHYVRDIFPPPDYTPRFHTAWLTSTVVALSRQMDESGDFSIAPILADALEDAGCDDVTLLQCCREPGGVHVRGNWVVDLVLGRG